MVFTFLITKRLPLSSFSHQLGLRYTLIESLKWQYESTFTNHRLHLSTHEGMNIYTACVAPFECLRNRRQRHLGDVIQLQASPTHFITSDLYWRSLPLRRVACFTCFASQIKAHENWSSAGSLTWWHVHPDTHFTTYSIWREIVCTLPFA